MDMRLPPPVGVELRFHDQVGVILIILDQEGEEPGERDPAQEVEEGEEVEEEEEREEELAEVLAGILGSQRVTPRARAAVLNVGILPRRD